MKIDMIKNDRYLEMVLEGRLDTTTAPELENKMNELEEIDNLVLNFEKLNYISSAGLRVLLSMQKVMNKQGKMLIINVSDNVRDVFEVTGFNDILNIQD